MNEKRQPKNNDEFLSALSRFLIEENEVAPNDLKDYLEKTGLNTEALLARAKIIFEKGISRINEERRERAKAEHSQFTRLFTSMTVSLPGKIEEIKEMINQFAEGKRGLGLQQRAIGAFRKFQDASDSDLRLILEELLKLEQIEKERKERSS